MFGSNARNISFQDLFTRSQQQMPGAAGSSVATTMTDTATRRERRASPRHATSVPALVPAAQGERVARMVSRDVPTISRQLLPSRRTQKGSIDFLLTGLSHDRVDPKLPSLQRPVAQAVKREPTRSFEGDVNMYPAYTHTHQQPHYPHASSRQLSRHESDESSDSYEGLPAPREAVRLPSIVAGVYTNQQQELQQQNDQASPAVESSVEEDTTGGKRKKKRKARICKEDGCDKYVVDHGLCIRHGGGKRCNVEDCNCRAQNRGLCWKHGGYTICKIEGCTKRAKSRGICWSHGGGTRCKSEGCSKIAVSLGRCWAHGGGKRCSVDGCKKPASERTNNYCADHFGWFQQEGGVQDV